jgi:tRNA threonylcarbamoyladenosine biosynthesis protein TsaB
MIKETNARHEDGGTVLGIDTSTATLAISIFRDGIELGAVQSLAQRNHSVLVVPEIKRLMHTCGIGPAEVDAIAVGQGPGSYTGVRIAATVGKTLAWAWNKPLLGISSLEALAWRAWELAQAAGSLGRAGRSQAWIVPVLDARRGQVYTARFAADSGGGWNRLDADGIRMADRWAAEMRQAAIGSGDISVLLFAGDVGLHAAHFHAPPGGIQVQAVAVDMAASAICKLAVMRLKQGDSDDPHGFVPNYTQLAEAEVKRLAATQGD